jgi:hypothetical protein
MSQYNTASAASSSLLRNIVSSFGQILQLELQRRMHNLAEKLERSKNTMHKKEATFKAFEKQSLSNESPAIPVSAVTNFFITSVRKVEGEDATKITTRIEIIFETQIRLHITPDCSLIRCRLRTQGVITVQSFPNSRVFNTLDLKLDMDGLYIAIRKECKYVSKQIVTGIVGFDIFDKKSKGLKKDQNHDESSRNEQEFTSSQFNGSDTVTHSTVATTDDNSLSFVRSKAIAKTFICADQRSRKNDKPLLAPIVDSATKKKKKNWLRIPSMKHT